ncbi:MAG TPA: FAD-dependent monooxygenase [Actinocrinis sp.]|nr:FAD-dependent monooxygenase [Actinocrinis sp.]
MNVSHPTRTDRTTVLIAGGGPAGLAAAAELGLRGVDCLLLEPRAEVSHRRPRAKTTSVRTMEHLRRWGVAGALRAAAPLPVAWSQRVTFCHSLTGARITDFENAFGLTTDRDERFAEAGQQVPQPVVEQVLRDHLSTLPNVELRLGHSAGALTQDDDGVTVTVHTTGDPADGETTYTIRAAYLLGCDGAAGPVREQIGAQYVGRLDPRPNCNLVFHAPGLDPQLGPAVQYWVVGDRTSGLVGRLDLHGTWWAVIPGIEAEYGREHASELITDLVGAEVEHTVLASDPWTARMLVADAFRDRRVFLVGESAHVNPPWGGHGFNTCVGDAVNLGWKIAAVEQGWAPPQLLDSYEPERRDVVEQTVASAESNMRALAGDLPRDQDAIQRLKRAEFHSLGLVLGYTYAHSPIIQPCDTLNGSPVATITNTDIAYTADVTGYQPTTAPGCRLPHAWLPDGSSLYDHLGPGFTLLGPEHPGTADLLARARRHGIPLTVYTAPASYPWHREFLLVRPDQHVAGRAQDPADLDLDQATGRSLTRTTTVGAPAKETP